MRQFVPLTKVLMDLSNLGPPNIKTGIPPEVLANATVLGAFEAASLEASVHGAYSYEFLLATKVFHVALRAAMMLDKELQAILGDAL